MTPYDAGRILAQLCDDAWAKISSAMDELNRNLWIPAQVPPKKDGKYLTLVISTTVVFTDMVRITPFREGAFDLPEGFAVTHWRPLPEPPAKDGVEPFISFVDDSDFTGGSKP